MGSKVVSDRLPRKPDMEKKIEIVQFANRTRQTFIRLLALVKWAGSASKVEKCANIVTFLDEQSSLFTDTADVLAKMARETLVQARLPCFQIPAAVEVLTLGTYSRLPTCIREKIVPPDPISPAEKRSTLLRLNQIIQQRLVTSVLPVCMRKNLLIENGRVTFQVDSEFELSLTVMGDGATTPWKVLALDILVTDRDTGDGKDLVHPLQVNFLQELIQSRLLENSRPLLDVYNVLHSFCLSLQLEVLNAQTVRLIRDRLSDFLWIDEYVPGHRLTVSYWKELGVRSPSSGMKMTLEIDLTDTSKPLQITHVPDLGEEAAASADESVRSDHLSFERLFIHTTHERAKQMLTKLRQELIDMKVGETHLSGCPSILEVCLLDPCMTSEKLLISTDTLTGAFLAHVPQFEDCPLIPRFVKVVIDAKRLRDWFDELRVWIMKQRCRKTVEFLSVQVCDTLPLVKDQKANENDSTPSLFIHFCKHQETYLKLVFTGTSDIRLSYSLLTAERVSFDGNSCVTPFETELPKSFLRIKSVVDLDTATITNKTSGKTDDNFGKRKQTGDESPQKKAKNTGFFIPELAFIISFCEEKLSYGSLSCELQRKQICHQVRVGNEPSLSHLIELVQFPPRSSGPASRLQKDLLNCMMRLQGKGNKIWVVSLCFCNCPIQTLSSKENASKKTVYLMYDFANGSRALVVQMVEELLLDWSAIDKLYSVVCDFGRVCDNYKHLVDIKSFTYKKLFLSYGPGKSYTVVIHWKSLEKRFQLNFGVTGTGAKNSNPHVLVSMQLQNEFNQHKSIATLIQTLVTTFEPLLSILKLSSIPLLGAVNSRPLVPVQTFGVIPQTASHLRLVYRNTYCIDIVIQADGLVAVRDGAISLFDKTKSEDLSPIPSFKSFLHRFVDKTAALLRRPSQADDDNPPSPHVESVDQYLFSTGQVKTSSPGGDVSGSNAMRSMHSGLSATMGSNPNTPSSPHTSMLSQVGYSASPGTGFPMASSPASHSLPGHHNMAAPSPALSQSNLPDQSPAMFSVNSPATQMHAPSPSFLPTPSPGQSAHMPSPAPNYMQAHEPPVNSPFHASAVSIHSPATAGWPGSPSIPRPSPSRPVSSVQSPGSCGQPLHPGQSPQPPQPLMSQTPAPVGQFPARPPIPQRNYLVSTVPTILTAKNFDIMCQPLPPDVGSPCNSLSQTLSQLDRFLGCVSMKRHLVYSLQRVASSQDESVSCL